MLKHKCAYNVGWLGHFASRFQCFVCLFFFFMAGKTLLWHFEMCDAWLFRQASFNQSPKPVRTGVSSWKCAPFDQHFFSPLTLLTQTLLPIILHCFYKFRKAHWTKVKECSVLSNEGLDHPQESQCLGQWPSLTVSLGGVYFKLHLSNFLLETTPATWLFPHGPLTIFFFPFRAKSLLDTQGILKKFLEKNIL